MRARDIVGKRVAAVRQSRGKHGMWRDVEVELEEIVFDDGTVLRFVVNEHDDGAGVKGIIERKGAA